MAKGRGQGLLPHFYLPCLLTNIDDSLLCASEEQNHTVFTVQCGLLAKSKVKEVR